MSQPCTAAASSPRRAAGPAGQNSARSQQQRLLPSRGCSTGLRQSEPPNSEGPVRTRVPLLPKVRDRGARPPCQGQILASRSSKLLKAPHTSLQPQHPYDRSHPRLAGSPASDGEQDPERRSMLNTRSPDGSGKKGPLCIFIAFRGRPMDLSRNRQHTPGSPIDRRRRSRHRTQSILY